MQKTGRMKKVIAITTMIATMAVTVLSPIGIVENAQAARMPRQVEALDRGLIAVSAWDGVFLSWRFLGTDPEDIGFNVYRNGEKINDDLITNSTNFKDASGNTSYEYYVEAVVDENVVEVSDKVHAYEKDYFDIPISIPGKGKTPANDTYTYSANDASCADLDGDGEYEIILKWDPSNSKDNAQNGYTGNVIIDAYKLDGTQLWRIDLGKNIRAGAHYTQFMVYDFDGDGYAEMVCKTADGTKDNLGNYIGDADADYRNSAGRILSGPEYLTLFDGLTGAAIHTIDYEPGRGDVSSWGDNKANRADRFLAAVAYLDGEKPSVIMCRGYYTRAVLVAYDVVNRKLVKRWTFDSNSPGNSAYAGQGNHNLAVADVDSDGYDEIVYGACTIDHDGTGLYSSGLGHGDALHVGDFLPDSPGVEIWGPLETKPYGAALRRASDGHIFFRWTADGDTGRGIAGNFIDGNGTAEFAAICSNDIVNGSNSKVAEWSEITKWTQNFALYWDGDLAQEVMERTMIDGYGKGRVLTAEGVSYNNGTKSNSSLCADIFGDWREEVIWPIYDMTALRVYTTTHETSYRIHTLMHDTQYRCQVASQNVAYNQPAHTSFFLDKAYPLPEQPDIYTADIDDIEGHYYFTNADGDMYIEIEGDLTDNDDGTQARKFRIVPNGDGYYYIMIGASEYKKCLEVADGATNDGANFVQGEPDGKDSQLFKFVRNDDNSYVILTKVSGGNSALSVCDGSTEDGSSIEQRKYVGDSSQRWYLEWFFEEEEENGVEEQPSPTPVPTDKEPILSPDNNPTPTPPQADDVDTHKIGKYIYKITNKEKKTVALCGATSKNIKKVNVKATINIDGVKYKVTSIDNVAFKNYKKVKTLNIGKNVKKIGKKVFFKCKKLKRVTVKTKKLKKVGSKAFKKTNKKMTIKAPKGKLAKYLKLFK